MKEKSACQHIETVKSAGKNLILGQETVILVTAISRQCFHFSLTRKYQLRLVEFSLKFSGVGDKNVLK